MKWRTLWNALVLSPCLLLAACSGGAGAKNGSSPVTISIGMEQGASGISASTTAKAPLSVATLNFTISAPDMNAITRSVVVTPPETVTESFDVTNGTGRLFVVEALAPDGATVYKGSVTVDLDGTAKDLTIVMQLMIFKQLIGTVENDSGTGIARDGNGNVIIVGNTYGSLEGNVNADQTFQTSDIFIAKYTASGAKVWTRQAGAAGFDLTYGVATDSGGNIYVVGSTDGSLNGNTNAGLTDCFLMKYDSDGNLVWTRFVGSAGFDFGEAIAVDVSGNIYVAGYTDGSMGGITNAGNDDLFVAKFDTSGVLQWVRQRGTTGYDQAEGLAVDTAGNLYVTGSTDGDLDGNVNAAGQPGMTDDLFLMKFDTSGAWQWTEQLGTPDIDQAWAVAADASGNAFVTGETYADLDSNTNADPTGATSDLFVAKYDTDGIKQWTRQLGSTSHDVAQGIALDSSGNVCLTGYTEGGLDGNMSAGLSDVFVVKYDAAGAKKSTWQAGSKFDDEGAGVAVDGSGNVLVAGATNGGYTVQTSQDDAFLIKFDAAGATQ